MVNFLDKLLKTKYQQQFFNNLISNIAFKIWYWLRSVGWLANDFELACTLHMSCWRLVGFYETKGKSSKKERKITENFRSCLHVKCQDVDSVSKKSSASWKRADLAFFLPRRSNAVPSCCLDIYISSAVSRTHQRIISVNGKVQWPQKFASGRCIIEL